MSEWRIGSVQLEAQNVTRRYGAVHALHDVSLGIRQGEFLTLLGPSGSGKSTFLNILAGFDRPTQGRLLQNGVDVTHRPAEQRNFGMVFQGYALFPHLSVASNVAFPLRVRKVARDEQKRRVDAVLQSVGLTAHKEKLPGQLSGGQQQRVALARALVFSPDILLLDEPLSALDKSLREQLQTELQRIHREFGTTFVFVTHDQSEALALSSRIAIFDHGHLQQIGTPEEVYTRPSSRFVAEFLGQINLFPLSNATSDGVTTTGTFEGRTLRVPGDVSGDVLLGVRPEHMGLGDSDPAMGNAVAATVTDMSYQGATIQLGLSTGAGSSVRPLSLTISTNSEQAQSVWVGKRVWLSWRTESGMALEEKVNKAKGRVA